MRLIAQIGIISILWNLRLLARDFIDVDEKEKEINLMQHQLLCLHFRNQPHGPGMTLQNCFRFIRVTKLKLMLFCFQAFWLIYLFIALGVTAEEL